MFLVHVFDVTREVVLKGEGFPTRFAYWPLQNVPPLLQHFDHPFQQYAFQRCCHSELETLQRSRQCRYQWLVFPFRPYRDDLRAYPCLTFGRTINLFSVFCRLNGTPSYSSAHCRNSSTVFKWRKADSMLPFLKVWVSGGGEWIKSKRAESKLGGERDTRWASSISLTLSSQCFANKSLDDSPTAVAARRHFSGHGGHQPDLKWMGHGLYRAVAK